MEKQKSDLSGKKITRKEAIKKTGYAALSTATMMILLNKKAQAGGSGASGPGTSGSNIGSASSGGASSS